jgi:hypothetical protein
MIVYGLNVLSIYIGSMVRSFNARPACPYVEQLWPRHVQIIGRTCMSLRGAQLPGATAASSPAARRDVALQPSRSGENGDLQIERTREEREGRER